MPTPAAHGSIALMPLEAMGNAPRRLTQVLWTFVNVILCNLKLHPGVLASHGCHVRHLPCAGLARLKGSGSGRSTMRS